MYSASDLKKGLKLEIDGAPWAIIDFHFSKFISLIGYAGFLTVHSFLIHYFNGLKEH